MREAMSRKKSLILYGGTYLNKGGAAIAYGTLKVLKELGIDFKYIIDPEPFFPFDLLDVVPIYRFSDTLSTNSLPSVNPIYTYKPFLKCLIKSHKSEIKLLRGKPIWHIGDSPFSDKRSVLSVIGQVIALQTLKAATNGKVIIGGISLEYPRTKIGKLILQHFFRKNADYLFVRGKETYATLQELGVSSEKISMICDFAFYLDKKESEETKNLSKLIREANKPAVALIFREYSYGRHREKYIEGIKKFASKLEEHDCKVFFIPTSYSYLLPENDQIFLEKVVGVDTRQIINIKDFCPEEIISIFSNFDVVISARLHGAVYGALANVPTIHLYEDRKSLEVIGNVFGNAIPLIKLFDFAEGNESNEIARIVENLLRKKNEISFEIKSRLKTTRENSIGKLRYVLLEEKHLLEETNK